MRNTNRLALATATATALALSLAACGDPPPDDRIPVDGEAAVPAATAELGPIQQASYERLNRDEVRENLATIFSSMAEGESLPPQEDMTFAAVDADEDGKINVAEFAVYHLRPDSADITEDQLTDAASAFFSHDADGSSLLDEAEFAEATGR